MQLMYLALLPRDDAILDSSRLEYGLSRAFGTNTQRKKIPAFVVL